MRSSRLPVVLLSLFAATSLVACGGGDDDASTTTAPDATDDSGAADDGADSSDPALAGEGDTGGVIVRIAGGPDEGDYQIGQVDPKCSVGVAGDDVFGVQFSDDSLTEGLTSLQATFTSPDDFRATATIGPFLEGGTEYDVAEGTAEVDPSDDVPTLHVNGTTADGVVTINMVVVCDEVIRA